MSVSADFAGIGPFSIRRPADQTVPFVFSSPHSGRHYPDRFLAMSRLGSQTIRRSEDFHVDSLFGFAASLGAPMIDAHFPRAYVDVNREPLELDPRMFADRLPPHANIRSPRVSGGLGTVPRVVGEGMEIYGGRLPFAEAVDRIANLYEPYHAALRDLLVETHARFGAAVLVDCHSMPSAAPAGGQPAADIIVGDRYGSSACAALSARVTSSLRKAGYRVAHNKPYAGGFITEHYGRPSAGVHAIQVEIARPLYMDERTMSLTPGYDVLRGNLASAFAEIVAISDLELQGYAQAAE